jgi:hypothetical protein
MPERKPERKREERALGILEAAKWTRRAGAAAAAVGLLPVTLLASAADIALGSRAKREIKGAVDEAHLRGYMSGYLRGTTAAFRRPGFREVKHTVPGREARRLLIHSKGVVPYRPPTAHTLAVFQRGRPPSALKPRELARRQHVLHKIEREAGPVVLVRRRLVARPLRLRRGA